MVSRWPALLAGEARNRAHGSRRHDFRHRARAGLPDSHPRRQHGPALNSSHATKFGVKTPTNDPRGSAPAAPVREVLPFRWHEATPGSATKKSRAARLPLDGLPFGSTPNSRETWSPAGAMSGIQPAPGHQTATLAGNMASALDSKQCPCRVDEFKRASLRHGGRANSLTS
jgi:hypothetical protein